MIKKIVVVVGGVVFFLQNFNVGDETKRKKMLHSIVLPIAISDIEILSRGIYQQQGNHNHHQYYFFRNCLFDVHKNIKKKIINFDSKIFYLKKTIQYCFPIKLDRILTIIGNSEKKNSDFHLVIGFLYTRIFFPVVQYLTTTDDSIGFISL